jgi:hypothetical protein
MSKPPVASPHPEGRVFGADWSIANVATLLRSNAGRGLWREAGAAGGYTAQMNRNYLRTVSVRHLPTNVSLIFMRLQDANCWYTSLCFTGVNDEYLPWNEDIAGQWLYALFGPDRPRVVGASATVHHESENQSVHQFTLA